MFQVKILIPDADAVRMRKRKMGRKGVVVVVPRLMPMCSIMAKRTHKTTNNIKSVMGRHICTLTVMRSKGSYLICKMTCLMDADNFPLVRRVTVGVRICGQQECNRTAVCQTTAWLWMQQKELLFTLYGWLFFYDSKLNTRLFKLKYDNRYTRKRKSCFLFLGWLGLMQYQN
jgi:hypothetical protein